MKVKASFLKLEKVKTLIDEDIKGVISYAETQYRGQLFELSAKVFKKKKTKMILLAGGSCAGKTTTARLIKEILEKMGKRILTISLDDFFKNRKDTPLLPNGNKDYDSLNALTLDEITESFKDLFEKGEADFPSYDFITGIHSKGTFHHKWDKNTVIIFEGLHTINPEIMKRLSTKDYLKVYAGPTSGFELHGIKMDPRELRFVRRAVRDVSRRGYSIVHTMKSWNDVIQGEIKYIDPYVKKVDFIIDTTHCYELGLYKKAFLQSYKEHKKELPDFYFLDVIKNAPDFNKTLVPSTSLMWEFVDKN